MVDKQFGAIKIGSITGEELTVGQPPLLFIICVILYCLLFSLGHLWRNCCRFCCMLAFLCVLYLLFFPALFRMANHSNIPCLTDNYVQMFIFYSFSGRTNTFFIMQAKTSNFNVFGWFLFRMNSVLPALCFFGNCFVSLSSGMQQYILCVVWWTQTRVEWSPCRNRITWWWYA